MISKRRRVSQPKWLLIAWKRICSLHKLLALPARASPSVCAPSHDDGKRDMQVCDSSRSVIRRNLCRDPTGAAAHAATPNHRCQPPCFQKSTEFHGARRTSVPVTMAGSFSVIVNVHSLTSPHAGPHTSHPPSYLNMLPGGRSKGGEREGGN